MTTTVLKIPEIDVNQASKEVTHNEALRMLDAFVGHALLSVTTAAEPGSSSDGDLYHLPAGATGTDWAGNDGKFAHRHNSQWYFYDAWVNAIFWIADKGRKQRWSGSVWVDVGDTAGKTYIDMSSGSAALTATQAAKPIIQIGGTPGAQVTLTFPKVEASWQVSNGSDSTVVLSTGAGSSVQIEAGHEFVVWGDGTGIRAGVTSTPNGLRMGGIFFPPIYSVSSAPDAAQNYRGVIFVSDGDTGAPCLACSDGSTWKRISLGATISAT